MCKEATGHTLILLWLTLMLTACAATNTDNIIGIATQTPQLASSSTAIQMVGTATLTTEAIVNEAISTPLQTTSPVPMLVSHFMMVRP